MTERVSDIVKESSACLKLNFHQLQTRKNKFQNLENLSCRKCLFLANWEVIFSSDSLTIGFCQVLAFHSKQDKENGNESKHEKTEKTGKRKKLIKPDGFTNCSKTVEFFNLGDCGTRLVKTVSILSS